MEGAARAHAVFVGVDRSLERGHRNQVRRGLGGRVKLHPRHVRRSVHAHSSVAARMACDPFDRIVAVFRIVHPGEETSLGLVSPPAVLGDGDVAVAGEEPYDIGSPTLLVVGRPHQQRRELAPGGFVTHGRQIDVRGKLDAVAHGDHYVALDDHVVGGPLGQTVRSGKQYGQNDQ